MGTTGSIRRLINEIYKIRKNHKRCGCDGAVHSPVVRLESERT